MILRCDLVLNVFFLIFLQSCVSDLCALFHIRREEKAIERKGQSHIKRKEPVRISAVCAQLKQKAIQDVTEGRRSVTSTEMEGQDL